MSTSRLARTNALYHNMHHTLMVALVGEDIIRGKLYRDGDVRSIDWLHFMVSLFSFGLGFTETSVRLTTTRPVSSMNPVRRSRFRMDPPMVLCGHTSPTARKFFCTSITPTILFWTLRSWQRRWSTRGSHHRQLTMKQKRIRACCAQRKSSARLRTRIFR